MSTEAVKKRGRPKKAIDVKHEIVVLEEPSKAKPKKSTTRRKTIQEDTENAPLSNETTKPVRKAPASRKKHNGALNLSLQKAPNLGDLKDDAAKANGGSAILQQATAFASNAPELYPDLTSRGKSTSSEAVLQSSSPFPVADNAGTFSNANPTYSSAEVIPESSTSPSPVPQELQSIEEAETAQRSIPQVDDTTTPDASFAASISADESIPPAQDSVVDTAPFIAPTQSATPPATPLPAGTPVSDTTPNSSMSKPESPDAVLVSKSSKPTSQLPPAFKPPPSPPPPLRPTQMPYSELKKNPEFKALSRKYTSLFIAIPIALFTSYVLYGRCK